MNKFKFSNAFLFVIMALVFGGLAGFLVLIILGTSNFNLPFIGQMKFSSGEDNRQIIIEQPRSVIVEQQVQLQQIEDDLFPALISVYAPKKSTNILDQAFLPSDVLSQGFMITADGWLLTTDRVPVAGKNLPVVVGYQNKQYAITQAISDKAYGLVFAKVSAGNLPVAQLGKASDLNVGQPVVIVSQRNTLSLTTIRKIGYQFVKADDLIFSSDLPSKQVFLSSPLDNSLEGAIVADLKGEIIGIIHNGKVILSDYFTAAINGVLQNKVISRPQLGIKYLDLAQADGLISIGDKGAYVVGNPAKDSPAGAKIKDGDIIEKVNDQELNAFTGLAEQIALFKPGDRIELTFLRKGREASVSVTLK